MDGAKRLFYAIEHNDSNEVLQCLADGMDPNGADELSRSPLHYAALNHSFETARALLNCGAGANAVDCEGQSPLHNACQAGDAEVCKLLLSHGADCLLEDMYGSTPLRVAALHQNWEIFAQLEEGVRESRTAQVTSHSSRVSGVRSR